MHTIRKKLSRVGNGSQAKVLAEQSLRMVYTTDVTIQEGKPNIHFICTKSTTIERCSTAKKQHTWPRVHVQIMYVDLFFFTHHNRVHCNKIKFLCRKSW